MHAGGATVVASAAFDGFEGGAQPLLNRVEAALADARAAGCGVVDENGGPAGVHVKQCGESAQVPAVAGGDERQQSDGGVFGGVQGAGTVLFGHTRAEQVAGLEGEPDRLGHEHFGRHGLRLFAQVLAAVDGESPVAGDLVGDLNLPAVHGERGELLAGFGCRVRNSIRNVLSSNSSWHTVTNSRPLCENTHLRALNGARVVVRVDAAEQNHALALAEGLDHVLRVLVNVDRARVPLAHGVRGVHGANQGAVFGVDELVGSTAGAADIDQVGG